VEETNYSVDDLKESRRGTRLSEIRHQAMSRMYEEGHSPTEIGKYFNRTPATVLYAHKKGGRKNN